MLIKINTKGTFKVVPEGDRVMTITNAECTPSGKPNKLKVTFQDDLEGGTIPTQYNFDNNKSLFAMGKLLETALGFEDGDEFDTKNDTPKLIGKKLLCHVEHSEGTQQKEDGTYPVFANVRRVSKIDEETGEVQDLSPRNAIAKQMDDLD